MLSFQELNHLIGNMLKEYSVLLYSQLIQPHPNLTWVLWRRRQYSKDVNIQQHRNRASLDARSFLKHLGYIRYTLMFIIGYDDALQKGT
jgi:hypothetical protein